jgi:hypothetical protein
MTPSRFDTPALWSAAVGRNVRPMKRVTLVVAAGAACVALVASASARSLLHRTASVYVLRGSGQVRMANLDWWCGMVPILSTTGTRGSAPECGPWDSGAVGLFMDWRPDPGDLSFTLPLQVYSYRRLRFVGRMHGRRIYLFSFAIVDHPKRPKPRRIPVGTIIGFKGSTWRCAPDAGSLTCAEIEHGKAQTPVVIVQPKRRLIEVQTTTPPTLLSGNGGANAPFLYQIDS